MASDDLRARIAEALCPPHHRIGSFSSGQPVTSLSPCLLHQAQADTVAALVQPELDELRGKVTALEASYEVVAADALAHGLCSLKRQGLLQRAEKAEAERDRLTAELHRHADCALCGHERHRHGYEPIIRRDWCSDCPTANDLHTFKEA